MMAMNMSPGIHRREFGFQKIKSFNEEAWKKVLDEAIAEEVEELPFKFYGFDIDRKVLQKAKANARRAGVDHLIDFRSEGVATVTPPCEKGIVIINPPYGTRLGDEDNLRDVYRDLGYSLKTRFAGWDVFVLSGNKDLIADLKLKASRKHFVYNGSLECRFLKYSIK
jgi:putative N6-adenine-specific DNA methylase